MDVNPPKYKFLKKIGFSYLVFFCLVFLVSCQPKKEEPKIIIDFSEKKQAVSINFKASNNDQNYSVRLKGSITTMFGSFTSNENRVLFTPIIPFSSGESYEILNDDSLFLEFSIPKTFNSKKPKLLGIFPKLDTVPENLLKMYFVFDTPMQQSQSTLEFIKVYEKNEGKEVSIFLPLENELWNTNRTELTLWLDPGRIKKDLIPNKKKGIPIKEGNSYELVVDASLQNENGISLGKSVVKQFYVSQRDTELPSINNWKLTVPTKGTKEALGISFGESLDGMLIEESIQVVTSDTEVLAGGMLVSKKGNNVLFVPSMAWEKGRYSLIIDSTFEDLAGNNFNRLFDTDLQKNQTSKPTKTKTIEFVVE